MNTSMRLLCASTTGALALALGPQGAAADPPEPFKITNIHFETNASGCDMGIQIFFDTDGITFGSVENPNDEVVFTLGSVPGLEVTHDITEVFQERVEPPILELVEALGCEPSPDAISLDELLGDWPEGRYEFEGESQGVEFEGVARLNHRIPAGPEILTPGDGDVVPHDQPLRIAWEPVTEPLLPELGPVQVVGYHVLLVDITNPVLAPGQLKISFNADVSANETDFVVPEQYLEPSRIYELEILATEKGGNQTISEGGVICTPPLRTACDEP